MQAMIYIIIEILKKSALIKPIFYVDEKKKKRNPFYTQSTQTPRASHDMISKSYVLQNSRGFIVQ